MNLHTYKIRFALLGVFVASLVPFSFGQARSDTSGATALTDRVDALFAQWDKPDSPGCALAIIKDGRMSYKRGYGMANLDYDIPISTSSVFYIASTSKQFTAASIALLAKEGKISLDDPIRRYLPELSELYNPVTIRHLIHHTSGIRDYLTLMSIAAMRTENVYTNEDIIELLSRQKALNFKPGEQHLYSNSGYLLLSVIVKRVTGKSLRQFADERIFKPLGMKNTHFHDDRTMIVKNRAISYALKKDSGFSVVKTNFDLVGDGGLLTTIDDLFLWDRNFYDQRLGELRLINQTLTPGILNSGKQLDYAFGLVVGNYKGLRTVSHGGSFNNFKAELIRFPEQRFSVICLCNVENAGPIGLARRVADIYLSEQFKPSETKTEVANAGATPKAQFIELSEEQLKTKTGLYRNLNTGSVWRLSVKDKKLMVEVANFNFQLVPVSTANFLALGGPARIEVVFPQDHGQSKTFTARVEGQDPATLQAIEGVSLTTAQTAEYAGDYFSDELQVTYKFIVEEGKLLIENKGTPKLSLAPLDKDRFDVRASGASITFVRDSQNRVVGFKLDAGRVTGIHFAKKI